MYELVIIGATSNICKTKVFKNLNSFNEFNKIYCYGWENWDNNDFIFYLLTNVKGNIINLIPKIQFIQGNYNDYHITLKNIVGHNTIIYVATPPICYESLLNYNKNLNLNCKIIFEKPFANNYTEYKNLELYVKNNVYMIDHFLYKSDILNIINKHKNTEINYFKISFIYSEDVENRLGYFDKTGLFKDMFQSHYLSVLYELIGDKIDNLLYSKINKNIRKQYHNYGGKNKNIDTYFYLELEYDGCKYIFESGKKMPDNREIVINDNSYTIKSYENEYELFFKELLNHNNKNIFENQNKFWKFYHYIEDNKQLYIYNE